MLAQSAAAQTMGSQDLPTIEQIVDEGRSSSGLAESIMEGLLGGVFNSPFSVGSPTTLFGVIFFAFNAFVFAVAVAWGTYGVVAGIVQTAHEGVVLGKRLNAVWVPIRAVTGVGSLLPVFGGFSLSQAVMILSLGWGIAGANYISRIGIEGLSNFVPMTNPTAVRGQPNVSARDVAFNLFMQRLCELGFERAAAEAQANGVPVASTSILNNNSASFLNIARAGGDTPYNNQGRGIVYGTADNPTACLAVGIVRNEYKGPGTNDSVIFRQLRNYSVQYETISTEAYNRYDAAFGRLSERARALADEYRLQYDQFLQSNEPIALTPAIPADRIMQLAADFTAADMGLGGRAQADNSIRAVHENVLEQVKGLGFLSLGMYHSMISEANTALNAALNAVNFHVSGASPIFEEGSNLQQAHYVQAAMRSAARLGFTGAGMESARNFNHLLQYDQPSGESNFGQKVLNAALGSLVTGTQDRAINNFALIDPIISAKNVGDYLMATGATLVSLPAIGKAVGRVIGGAAKLVGKGAQLVPGGQKAGKALEILGSAASEIMKWATPLGWLMLIVGAILAIYIPFVPFLNWVSAMVQYVSTVVQAFVAAPIWSLAHMDMSGEGMGQRTERGYVWILFVLFKPALMVIAFFAATGMVILIGSVVTWIYLPVVANVQGNSVTGIFSIIGFILLYFVLLNIIIQGSFNLVEEISDEAIGWIGGVNRSSVGKGMDQQMGAVFINNTKAARGEALAIVHAAKNGGKMDPRSSGDPGKDPKPGAAPPGRPFRA